MDRLKALAGKFLENLIITVLVTLLVGGGAGALVAALLGVVDDDVALPTWALILAVVALAGAGLILGYLINRRREANPLARVAHHYLTEAELHAGYAEHLSRTLDQLQNVIAGGIPGVGLEQFIERGILDPGRDMLKGNQPRGEDVRISILKPEGDRFTMPYASGHSPEGQAKFQPRIADTFSRHAYEQGQIVESGNVQEDERFKPLPEARRPYKTLVSVPLRSGGSTIGVFNVVSTCQEAFDVSDYTYIVLLAAIANVAIVSAEANR